MLDRVQRLLLVSIVFVAAVGCDAFQTPRARAARNIATVFLDSAVTVLQSSQTFFETPVTSSVIDNGEIVLGGKVLNGKVLNGSHSNGKALNREMMISTVAKKLKIGAAAPAAPPAPTGEVSMIDTPAAAYQTLASKGEANANMSNLKTVVSAMLGGAYVGIGGMLSLAAAGNIPGIAASNPGLARFIFAALFPVNLLMALQCGGQLFTGNTANMVAAVCEKNVSWKNLGRSWMLSWFGNATACTLCAILFKYCGVLSGGAGALAASTFAAKTSMAMGPLIVKAMMCNWLVCLAVYLSMQAKDMTGKFLAIWLPISAFVSIGFEHSVANMFLLPAGLLSGEGFTIQQALFSNLIPVTIGNAISGSLLVGAMFSFMFGKLGEGK